MYLDLDSNLQFEYLMILNNCMVVKKLGIDVPKDCLLHSCLADKIIEVMIPQLTVVGDRTYRLMYELTLDEAEITSMKQEIMNIEVFYYTFSPIYEELLDLTYTETYIEFHITETYYEYDAVVDWVKKFLAIWNKYQVE